MCWNLIIALENVSQSELLAEAIERSVIVVLSIEIWKKTNSMWLKKQKWKLTGNVDAGLFEISIWGDLLIFGDGVVMEDDW